MCVSTQRDRKRERERERERGATFVASCFFLRFGIEALSARA